MSNLKAPLNPAKEKLSNQPSSKLKYFSSIFQFREFFSNGRDSLVGKSIISTVDQVALSAANFTVGVILLKTVSLGDYGRYSFFFSLLMLIVATHGALIVSPMNVLIAGKRKQESNQYITSLFVGQLLAFLPFVILGVAAVFLSQFSDNVDFSLLTVGAVLLAGLGAVCREFFKPVFYNRPRAEFVLWIDLLYIGVYLTLFFTTVLFDKIQWLLVYIYMFSASTFAGILGIYYLRRSNLLSKLRNIGGSLRENFEHGRWILPAVIIANISNYSFMYLLIFLLGDKEAGLASGTRLLVMPLLLCMQSWIKVAVPHGSKLSDKNQLSSLKRILLKSTFVFILGIAFYGFVIFLFIDDISGFLFEEKIGSEVTLIFLWLGYSAAAIIRRNATIGLQVFKYFKQLLYLSILTTVIGLIFGYVFIKVSGIEGSLLAMILSEIILAAISWIILRRLLKRSNKGTQNAIQV